MTTTTSKRRRGFPRFFAAALVGLLTITALAAPAEAARYGRRWGRGYRGPRVVNRGFSGYGPRAVNRGFSGYGPRAVNRGFSGYGPRVVNRGFSGYGPQYYGRGYSGFARPFAPGFYGYGAPMY